MPTTIGNMNRRIDDFIGNASLKPMSFLRLIFIFGVVYQTFLTAGYISRLEGKTDTVLILHTNDIHDHLRPDYDGAGGLPYVSGYIKSIRARRSDVLVLDAGDVAEKGDMVAFETDSEITYQALGMIGYDAGTFGNHDHDFGIPQLHKFQSLAGEMKILCLNLIKENGDLEFTPSAIFDVDGVKVGVIGAIVPRKELGLNQEETIKAPALEAKRLDERVDLVIAVCHISSKLCRMISLMAPEIDVFVSGHSHEAIPKAIVVEETGAYIVQAGSYAEYVGRLELEIDLTSKKIISAKSELVPMKHDTVPLDEEMLEWVLEKERAITPQASRFVFHNDSEIDRVGMGRLGAAALRASSGADIGFCNADQVIRATLPVGDVDINAIFRTGGQRGYEVIKANLKGNVIEAYLNALKRTGYPLTQWSGFRAIVPPDGNGSEIIKTDLDPDRLYSIIMPKKEWDTRLLRSFWKVIERNIGDGIKVPQYVLSTIPTSITFTDAVTDYITKFQLDSEKITLSAHINEIAKSLIQ